MPVPKLSISEVLNISEYCAEEVRRQQRGPTQVGWMIDAWMQALRAKNTRAKLTHTLIQQWAHMIEREKNVVGEYRHVGVRVGDRICPRPEEVHDRMERWLEMLPNMTPIEAYKEFEFVHPFVDGNGRVGKIILNYLNGWLRDPIFPPANIFGYSITNP